MKRSITSNANELTTASRPKRSRRDHDNGQNSRDEVRIIYKPDELQRNSQNLLTRDIQEIVYRQIRQILGIETHFEAPRSTVNAEVDVDLREIQNIIDNSIARLCEEIQNARVEINPIDDFRTPVNSPQAIDMAFHPPISPIPTLEISAFSGLDNGIRNDIERPLLSDDRSSEELDGRVLLVEPFEHIDLPWVEENHPNPENRDRARGLHLFLPDFSPILNVSALETQNESMELDNTENVSNIQLQTSIRRSGVRIPLNELTNTHFNGY